MRSSSIADSSANALQPLTAALLECLTPSEVVSVIVERGQNVLGARAGLVALVTDDGQELEILRADGYAPNMTERWGRFSVQGPYPLSEAVRTGSAIYLETRADWLAHYPALTSEVEHTLQAAVSLPLIARRRVLGAIHFSFHQEQTFTDEDCAFLEELARQAALAMDRAFLLAEVKQARADAEEARAQAETILESIGEEFYALDVDGRFLYVNRRAEIIWQRSRQDLLGQNIWDVFPTAVGGTSYEAQITAFRERRVTHFESISTVRGRWIEGTVYPTDNGGISVYLRDIQDRKTTETALQQGAESLAASETRYRRLLDTALEGVMFLDTQARTTRVNQRFAAMLGYASPDELMGRSVFLLLFPEDEKTARARWETRLQGTEDAREHRLKRKDGSECWVIAHVSVERDEASSAVLGTFTMFTDVTERRKVQQALQAKTDEVTAILESITDAFFALDSSWRFTYINNEAERVLFRTRDDLLGKDIWEEFPAALDSAFDHEYHRAIREQVSVAFVDYYAPLDTWFEVNAYPSATGLSVYFRNVNEARRAQMERERLQIELKKASLLQAAFRSRDMLMSVTEGGLCLCDDTSDLPERLSTVSQPMALSSATLRRFRRHVAVAADTLKLPPLRTQDLMIATGEAAMNAVTHGGGGQGQICTDATTGKIQVWIHDQGAGIREEDLHRATLEKGWSGAGSLGHGFFLILRTCDRTYLLTSPHGTTVVLEQSREPQQPTWLSGKGDRINTELTGINDR